jgi:N-acetylglucosamine transport system permease protein
MSENKASIARRITGRWLLRLLLIFILVVMIFPLIWNVYSSFKTNTEFMSNAFALPTNLEWDNYARALLKSDIFGNFMNSIYVVVVSLVVIMVCAIPTAYCLSRYKFFASKIIMNIYMAAIFIQATYIMIPLFLQMNDINMLNKLTPLGIVYAVMQFPFSIFLLSGFLRTIPKDYEEAAMIDGCNHYGILLKIIVPMSKSGIVTVGMLSAMAAWNEYAVALVMITDENKLTIPIGVARLFAVARYATDWGAMFAALVIVLIPTIILYCIGQRYLIQGINMGGLKG